MKCTKFNLFIRHILKINFLTNLLCMVNMVYTKQTELKNMTKKGNPNLKVSNNNRVGKDKYSLTT